tara:strand:- start:247 stop:969 length:723 start_codon:yes stop_codon:yes gene_type:complete
MDTKNSIWNTQKKSVESKSVWGSMESEPQQQQVDSNISTFQVDHVYKSIPIFTTILADHVEFNKYLKQVILEHRQNNPETTKSNVKAWHSSWTTHEENPKFKPLVDRICDACSFVSQGYFQCQTVDFVPFNFWVMMYEEGEHTIRHSHFPADFSAVYYVDVEPNCAPVLFEVPQNDGVNDRNEAFTLQPKNGMLAVWPSMLHHEVPPTKGKRMCVSMNIDKKHIVKGMDGLSLNAPGFVQ